MLEIWARQIADGGPAVERDGNVELLECSRLTIEHPIEAGEHVGVGIGV